MGKTSQEITHNDKRGVDNDSFFSFFVTRTSEIKDDLSHLQLRKAVEVVELNRFILTQTFTVQGCASHGHLSDYTNYNL